MKKEVIYPATKRSEEKILRVGEWYTTFTTGSDGRFGHAVDDYIFRVDSIDDKVHITTFTGIEKSLSATHRSQFTKNATSIDEQEKQRLFVRLFEDSFYYI